MKSFYKHLKAGKGKAEALRQAKLDMIRSDIPAYRFPYFWAPFVLLGQANMMVVSSPRSRRSPSLNSP